RAQVGRGVVVGEHGTFTREPIDVRRPHALRAERTDVAVTEVVAKNDDEVRRALCAARRSAERGRAESRCAVAQEVPPVHLVNPSARARAWRLLAQLAGRPTST